MPYFFLWTLFQRKVSLKNITPKCSLIIVSVVFTFHWCKIYLFNLAKSSFSDSRGKRKLLLLPNVTMIAHKERTLRDMKSKVKPTLYVGSFNVALSCPFFYFFRAGKKLVAIMNEIELTCRQHTAESNGNFVQPLLYPVVPSLLSSKQRKQVLQYGCMVEGKLLTNNLEAASSLKLFRLGQVS